MKKRVYKPLLILSAVIANSFSALPSPAWAAGISSTAFPVKFRGHWYHAPGPYDRNTDRLALHVGARSLNYFDEFSGRLTRIISRTGRTVDYTAEYSAEGRRWNSTEKLSLSPKGNEMTLEPQRTAARYFRCTVGGAR